MFSHLTVKWLFLMSRKGFLYFSLCLLPFVLVLGTAGKNLAQSPLHPASVIYIHH